MRRDCFGRPLAKKIRHIEKQKLLGFSAVPLNCAVVAIFPIAYLITKRMLAESRREIRASCYMV